MTIENGVTNAQEAVKESFNRYFSEHKDQFYEFNYSELNDAIQSVRRQQGVEDSQPFEPIPDNTFIEHNGSILVESRGKYFWTRGQEKINDLLKLGLTQGDKSIGVPFANAMPGDLKWRGMQMVVEAVNQSQIETQRREEQSRKEQDERQVESAATLNMQKNQDLEKADRLLEEMKNTNT